MSQILDHVKTEPLLVVGLLPRITVPRSIAFACVAALLLAGSGITSVIPVQAEDVLIAGNHGNNSNKDKSKGNKGKSKSKGDKNNANNCDKSNDKSKCNNGVRDHGIGYGKDKAGQGKGLGHKNKK